MKSMYGILMNGHARFLCRKLWKQKIPLKINIFIRHARFIYRKI
jgi:hypothetical protein